MAKFIDDDKFNFPREEIKILEFWKKEHIFEKIQDERRRAYEANQCRIFSFYDGPPFATGLPHYGHILAGSIKDIVTRFATQNNCYVERRFGWDCHGLPVEYEIDKHFGIRSSQDVEAMGIAVYNNECRKIVMRYSSEWEMVVKRMGRWVDFRNDYKTMYVWFMESVWWVFSQLFAKGLIYKGSKVMPYSVGCRTPVSNFEAGQNYKDVEDVAVTVAFDVVSSDDVSKVSADKLLIWTTTPWSIPANLAVCVNPNIDYVRLRDNSHGSTYILAKNRVKYIFSDYMSSETRYEIIEVFKGVVLKNLKYHPPFKYYEEYGKRYNAFRVLLDDYVTEENGTGLVHQAAYFGEDDYRICYANDIVTKTSATVCPIDENGVFTEEIPDLKGCFYKDANSMIIEKLKAEQRVVNVKPFRHSYPFCWRSDTPLIYKSVSCWFVRVEHMAEALLKNNAETDWTPEVVKEKRFANWLSNARDWAVSRKRHWGTPIPIWTSESGDEIVCIGSLAELKQKTGTDDIVDLHRESIDHLVIPSAVEGRPPLRRIDEVFDCWFESGAMPYAQAHYPFENQRKFHDTFPADFIAEGIDQTRGWFYTLLVLSTALFDRPPFRNVIVNGLVLAADGQKMSKRKQNYADPMDVMNKHGSDALRLYLINSPLVRGGNLNFKEDSVRNMLKCVFLPWYNALRFLQQNVERFEQESQAKFQFDEQDILQLDNCDVLDIWILSKTESNIEYVKDKMQKYQLQSVSQKLIEFIDELTNWYVRLKRSQIKGEEGLVEERRSLQILFYVQLVLSKIMASFAPFFSEYVYQELIQYIRERDQISSVHNCLIPWPKEELIQTNVEVLFQRFKRVVELGRKLRERKIKPLKYPLAEIVVLHTNQNYLDSLRTMESYLTKELNCKRLTLTNEHTVFGVHLRAEGNHEAIGKRFKQQSRTILEALRKLSDCELEKAIRLNKIDILGHEITTSEEIHINYDMVQSSTTSGNYEFAHDQEILIAMDFATTNDQMRAEGVVREIINRIQKLKKVTKLKPTDKVRVYYEELDENILLSGIILENAETIARTIKSDFRRRQTANDELKNIIAEQVVNIKNSSLKLTICVGE